MSELLYRLEPVDLQVRPDKRTIVGLAVPFDEPATVSDGGRPYREVFRRGAFARTIRERGAERVKLLAHHDARQLIGRASLLREEPRGLYLEAMVSRTVTGDETLELVRDGALDALSIGFRPVAGGDHWNSTRDEVERTEVALREISVVTFASYAGASILAVRHAPTRQLPIDLARKRLALLQGTP